jgi:hypothetical protein
VVKTTVDAKRTSRNSNGCPDHEFGGYEIYMSFRGEDTKKILTDITPYRSPVNDIGPPNNRVDELD